MKTYNFSNNKSMIGIYSMIISSFFFSLMSLFVKLSGDVPIYEKIVYRNGIAIIIAFLAIKFNHQSLKINKSAVFPIVARSLCGIVGIVCNFYAISKIPMANAAILWKVSPAFTVLFCALILKESFSKKQLLCLLAAFIGCAFVIKPQMNLAIILPGLIALAGGIITGLSHTMIRVASKHNVSGNHVVFYFCLITIVICLPLVLFHYSPLKSTQQLLYLVLMGISGAFAQLFLTLAYFNAPANQISIYGYTQVVFAALMDILLFNVYVDYLNVIGYCIIAISSIYMFSVNRKNNI